MKKVIVTTTINPVTEALQRYQRLTDWELVVVGDKNTPSPYMLNRGIYVSPDMQERYDKALSDAIGWNCVPRRNFGLLWAKDMGADIIALVDDDNRPFDHWGQDLLLGSECLINYYETSLPAFDPVGATNVKHLWHRGYPLQLIPERDYLMMSRKKMCVDVQADFWNGAPDVDALCRMAYKPQCEFDPGFFPLGSNVFSPFNSQNTFLSKKVLPHYFLFPHVGRMNDIWAAYYVQALGYKVVYQKPSVYQLRNPHDLIADMREEYIGYENNLQLVEALSRDHRAIQKYLPPAALRAFELYQRHFTG